MRLWSLHPVYLDSKGLVALWREGLLAQKVLLGATRGYRNHPQLERFKLQAEPVAAIAAYLREVQIEATRRGYRFDASKIVAGVQCGLISVTDGQVAYEVTHLKAKLQVRAPAALERWAHVGQAELHPLFTQVDGLIETWEVL